MKNGKLVRVKSSHNNLRTTEVVGSYYAPPTIGESFTFLSEPLNDGGTIRVVTTSPVQSVEAVPGGLRFTTLNSTYDLIKEENA